jgi:dTDP-4-dehydrorhamnose reductase
MKKILITGGSGQLAQSFKLLFKHEYNLSVLDKKLFDITDPKIVEKTLVKERPDIVINCAAMTNVDGCENDSENAYLINGLAIENFVRFFDGLFIQLSTDYVFDGIDGPYLESSETNPISIYGKSKLLGEEIVKTF